MLHERAEACPPPSHAGQEAGDPRGRRPLPHPPRAGVSRVAVQHTSSCLDGRRVRGQLPGPLPGVERLLPAAGAEDGLAEDEPATGVSGRQSYRPAKGPQRLGAPSVLQQDSAQEYGQRPLVGAQRDQAFQGLDQLLGASAMVKRCDEARHVLETAGLQIDSRRVGPRRLHPAPRSAENVAPPEVQLRLSRRTPDRLRISPGRSVRPGPFEGTSHGDVKPRTGRKADVGHGWGEASSLGTRMGHRDRSQRPAIGKPRALRSPRPASSSRP
jgi:hypothetical protein